MATTSELIGRLGGSDVQSSDISLEGKPEVTNISTVTVPSGATILVVIIGEFARGVASHQDTGIIIGGVKVGVPNNNRTYLSVVKVLTSTEDIELDNSGDYRVNPFTGTLYLVGL